MSILGFVRRCTGILRRRAEYWIVCRSSLWDADWYCRVYRIQGKVRALKHYCTVGWKTGFDPSPYFSSESYLEKSPDVRAAGINPVIHYERSGKYEFRPFDCSTRAGE